MIGRLLVLAGAPVLLGAADPPLGEPVTIAAGGILYAASPSVRAASWALLDQPFNAPVTVNLVCLADRLGRIEDCLSQATPLDPKIDWRGFTRLAGLDSKEALDHSLIAIARLRARQTLLSPLDGRDHYLVRLQQTISPSDAVASAPPARIIDKSDIRFPESLSVLASRLYPKAALRQGARARVTVKCIVRDDMTLFCHSGQATGHARPGDGEDLIFATYQALSVGKIGPARPDGPPLVGAEVSLSLNWTLPG